MKHFELLVGTRNPGKILELTGLFAKLPVKLMTLRDFASIAEVEETGSTFEENAVLKARSYASESGIWTLADDSGLEVEALAGSPGVFSARYAGEHATFKEKIDKLLKEVMGKERRARFVCVIAIADDKGELRFTAEGICNGKLAFEPRGAKGFGYDPIFIPDGFDRTFGELEDNIKQQISHRALAFAKIIRFLRDFIAV